MSEQPTMPPEKKEDNISIIKMLLVKLKALFKKHRHKEEDDALFEKKLENIEKKLDEFDEQDAIHSDCLRDVAQTLSSITGVMEGGEINDYSPEAMNELFADIDKKLAAEQKKGRKAYTASSERIEDVLAKAFGDKDVMDKIYTKDENGKRVLSKDVKLFRSMNGENADLYLSIKGKAVKINDIRRENLGSGKIREEVVLENSGIFEKDDKFFLRSDPDTPLREIRLSGSRSIEEAIGKAMFRSKKDYLMAQRAKNEGVRDALLAISGTPDAPFEKDNFYCISDERGYSIKDRHTNRMLTLSFDPTTSSIKGMCSTVKGFESVTEPQQVMEMTMDNGILRYNFKTDRTTDMLLETEMAQTWLSICGVPQEKYQDIRHIDTQISDSIRVPTAEFRKVELLKDTLDNNFRTTKGLEGYKVYVNSPRGGGTQLSIVAPDQSRFILDFDDKGNIKNQKWAERPLGDGSEERPPVTVVSVFNNTDMVLNREAFNSTEFALCYASVKTAVNQIADKVMGQGISFGTSMSAATTENRSDVQKTRFIKEAAAYAANALVAHDIHGHIENSELVNHILNEVESQTGTYPSAEYRKAVSDNIFSISAELSQLNYIDNAYFMNAPREERVYTPEMFRSEGIFERSAPTGNKAKAPEPKAAEPKAAAEAPTAAPKQEKAPQAPGSDLDSFLGEKKGTPSREAFNAFSDEFAAHAKMSAQSRDNAAGPDKVQSEAKDQQTMSKKTSKSLVR